MTSASFHLLLKTYVLLIKSAFPIYTICILSELRFLHIAPLTPSALPLPVPPGHQTLSDGPQPMDLDGTRGYKGALTMEERRRRSDAGLCAYCG